MKLVLQNRWKIDNNYLIYYGLRKKPNTFKNKIKISMKTKEALFNLDSFSEIKSLKEIKSINARLQINKLIKEKIIVDIKDLNVYPDSLDQANYCIHCSANDYIIPGLELDEKELCPICSNFKSLKKIHSVLPTLTTIPKNKAGNFDLALFYTGGKDSSFLLNHLIIDLKLNPLVLTWNYPFFSNYSKENIESAKGILKDTVFINKSLNKQDESLIYKRSMELNNNPCICPFPAYALFLETLREKKIPYLLLGNEPTQMISHIYNNISKKIMYKKWAQSLFRVYYNTARLLTFKKPLKKGQIEFLILLENLAYGKARFIKSKIGDTSLIANIHESLKAAPNFINKLRNEVEKASKDGNLPCLIHMDFNKISKKSFSSNKILEDSYDWNRVKKILEENLNWKGQKDKLLHTSCDIESCKDYTQFIQFKNMETLIIPLSALEMSIAVNMKSISRQDAIKELKNKSGFRSTPPSESKIMEDLINL